MNISLSRILIRLSMILFLVLGMYVFLELPSILSLNSHTKKSINILVWPNVIESKHCAEFEQKTGIKVYLTYFESYESLLVNLKASGGDEYDLVMVADYFVPDMVAQGIIQKIDRNKIKIWDRMHPEILNLAYDPHNQYTIPFSWEVYGLGVDMTYFKDRAPDSTWGILFDQEKAPEHVGMLDSAREVVSIASLYLFGPQHSISDVQLAQVQQLLMRQKEWVVMYSDLRSDYMLASKMAPVVLAVSSEIYQAMRYNKNIKFLLPREGSFMMVDNFVIPAQSKKQDYVCEFINYLYNPDIMREYVTRYNFFPSLKNVHADDHLYLAPIPSLLSRLRLFTRQTSDQNLRKLWISLKS